ncbi:hypothetical protein G9A89_011762 [Geosiphon pyriformis]|nr:hypothetical protein G9A89_011762 [Geosiphon pyriformis]
MADANNSKQSFPKSPRSRHQRRSSIGFKRSVFESGKKRKTVNPTAEQVERALINDTFRPSPPALEEAKRTGRTTESPPIIIKSSSTVQIPIESNEDQRLTGSRSAVTTSTKKTPSQLLRQISNSKNISNTPKTTQPYATPSNKGLLMSHTTPRTNRTPNSTRRLKRQTPNTLLASISRKQTNRVIEPNFFTNTKIKQTPQGFLRELSRAPGFLGVHQLSSILESPQILGDEYDVQNKKNDNECESFIVPESNKLDNAKTPIEPGNHFNTTVDKFPSYLSFNELDKENVEQWAEVSPKSQLIDFESPEDLKNRTKKINGIAVECFSHGPLDSDEHADRHIFEDQQDSPSVVIGISGDKNDTEINDFWMNKSPTRRSSEFDHGSVMGPLNKLFAQVMHESMGEPIDHNASETEDLENDHFNQSDLVDRSLLNKKFIEDDLGGLANPSDDELQENSSIISLSNEFEKQFSKEDIISESENEAPVHQIADELDTTQISLNDFITHEVSERTQDKKRTVALRRKRRKRSERLTVPEISVPRLPKSLVKKVFKTFCKTRTTNEAMEAIFEGSHRFFEQASEDLAYLSDIHCNETITENELTSLMRSHRVLSERVTLKSLAEKMLPRTLSDKFAQDRNSEQYIASDI